MLSKALVKYLVPEKKEEIEKVICEKIHLIKQLIEGESSSLQTDFLEKICNVAKR